MRKHLGKPLVFLWHDFYYDKFVTGENQKCLLVVKEASTPTQCGDFAGGWQACLMYAFCPHQRVGVFRGSCYHISWFVSGTARAIHYKHRA